MITATATTDEASRGIMTKPPLIKIPIIPPWIKSRRVVMRFATLSPLHANGYVHHSARDSTGAKAPHYHAAVGATALTLAHLSAVSNRLYTLVRLVHVQALRPTPTPRNSSPANTTIAGPDGRSR